MNRKTIDPFFAMYNKTKRLKEGD